MLLTSLDQPPYPDLTFTLNELLDIGVLSQVPLIAELAATATGEAQLEETLKVSYLSSYCKDADTARQSSACAS